MTEHNLLILGSMDEFIPLVNDAKARGYKTIVADGYKDGPAKQFADVSYDVAVDNTDSLMKICFEQEVDGMITAYSDVLFENIVKLSCATGIPCYGNYAGMQWLRSKTKMKRMFEMQGIPFPKSMLLENKEDVEDIDLQFPCVMKPRDGYGSRGIFVVNDKDEAREKYDLTEDFCLNERGVIIEEYCAGHEFNMITWVSEGRVSVISIADREKSYEVEGDIPHVSRLVYPSRFWQDVIEDARNIVQKVSVFTGVKDGPLCMQFFWSPEEGINVCEIAGRVFGYEHELVELGSSLKVEDLLLDTVYDHNSLCDRLASHSIENFKGVRAGLYFHGKERMLGSIDGAKRFLSGFDNFIEDTIWYYSEGDEISHGRGAKPYLLRLYVKADDIEELDVLTEKLFSELTLEDQSGDSILYHNEIPSFQ